jgi:release factor glutamine methyltransferase
MTDVQDVLARVQHELAQAGIESPSAEAAIIVSHVLKISRGKLGVLQMLGEQLNEATVRQITDLARSRATRIPLQQLTGETTFYGVDLKMQPGVFIPRMETEVLVETTLHHFASVTTGELTILDLCTGSGAIAAALADQFSQRNVDTRIWAVDRSVEAVKLARHNTGDYKVSVLCSDATDAQALRQADPLLASYEGRLDAVVANPPYIPTATPVTQAEAEHDPTLALYGGSADGLVVPLAIAEVAAEWLAPGGFFMMEHDHTHAAELAAELDQNPQWQQVRQVYDLTGTERFVSAVRA